MLNQLRKIAVLAVFIAVIFAAYRYWRLFRYRDAPPAIAAPAPSEKFRKFDFSAARLLFLHTPANPRPLRLTPPNLSPRWQYIIIHHSGALSGNVEIFTRVHRARGMERGMAYHFVIGNGRGMGDGEIAIGSRWQEQIDGGHVRGDRLNHIAIGICLVGDFTRYLPTVAQIAALKSLLRDLQALTGNLPILGHKDAPQQATKCPGNLPVNCLTDNRQPATGKR